MTTPLQAKIWYQKNREYALSYRRERRRKVRAEILSHYGGKCACCGYADTTKQIFQSGQYRSFLQLDHINGYSKNDIHKGDRHYRFLKKAGFPDGFRILCAACNAAMETGAQKCELHR